MERASKYTSIQNLYPETLRYYKGIKLSDPKEIDFAVRGLFAAENSRRRIANTRQHIIEKSGHTGPIKRFLAEVISRTEVTVFEPNTHVIVYKEDSSQHQVKDGPILIDGAQHFPDMYNQVNVE